MKSKILGLGLCFLFCLMISCGENSGSGDEFVGGGSSNSNFVTIQGGTFIAGAKPAPSQNANSPAVAAVTGDTAIRCGGNGTYAVTFTIPDQDWPRLDNRLRIPSKVIKVIVFIQGDAGYFTIPIANPSSGAFSFVITTNANLAQNITTMFAVIDNLGNVSDYHSLDVKIYQANQLVIRFVDNGDGTITDTHTRLIWQKDQAPVTLNWSNSMSYCDHLSLAGPAVWRLPTQLELMNIFGSSSRSCGDYLAYLDNIFECTQAGVWSATEYDRTRAYYVNFNSRDSNWVSKTGVLLGARCVR